jgi:tetratricopeptide (TPR) repeat protein
MSHLKPVLTALFALGLAGLPAACGDKEEDTAAVEAKRKKDLADAAARLRNNKLEDAERIYTRVLEKHPEDPEALAGMGRLRYQQHHTEQAEKFLSKAIALDASVAKHHAILGELYALSDRHEEAVSAYGKAWGLDSEKSEYGLPYGRELNRVEKYAEAEAVLREVMDLDPQALTADGIGVHTALADSLRGQKKLEDALKMYMKAQSTYQSDKMAFAGAAFVYEEQEDITHALGEWSAYIQRDCCSDYSRTVAQKKIMELEPKNPEGDTDPEAGDGDGDGKSG